MQSTPLLLAIRREFGGVNVGSSSIGEVIQVLYSYCCISSGSWFDFGINIGYFKSVHWYESINLQLVDLDGILLLPLYP